MLVLVLTLLGSPQTTEEHVTAPQAQAENLCLAVDDAMRLTASASRAIALKVREQAKRASATDDESQLTSALQIAGELKLLNESVDSLVEVKRLNCPVSPFLQPHEPPILPPPQ